MLNSKIVKEAHKMTREIKRECPEVNYHAQLGLCLSCLLKEEGNTMVELKGSEKQVKWANELLNGFVEGVNYIRENAEKAIQIAIEEEDYSQEEGKEIVVNGLKEIEELKNEITSLQKASEIISKLKEIVKKDTKRTGKNIQYRVSKKKYASKLLDNIVVYL